MKSFQDKFIDAFSEALRDGDKHLIDEYTAFLCKIATRVWKERYDEKSAYSLETLQNNCRSLLRLSADSGNRDAMIAQLSTPEMEQVILNRYIEKVREIFSPPGFIFSEGGIPKPKSGKDFVVVSPEEAKAGRKAKESVPTKARAVIAEHMTLQQSSDLAANFRRSFAYNCALYMNSFMDEYDPLEILHELYEIFEENYRNLLDYFKVTEIDPYKSAVGFPLSADLESFIDMLVFSKRIPKKKIKELKQAMEEAKAVRSTKLQRSADGSETGLHSSDG